jgi:haloacetate dehalogenase
VLEGFKTEHVAAGRVTINVSWGGAGPPLLLLHGYPQTHVMWRRVASMLAPQFTVVCPDLRGYGDSDKPAAGDGDGYSKRVMAADQVEVMFRLGFERFAVAGHDRGGRVALRMALDHPERVSRLTVLDIVPTKTIYETIDQERARTVWRYFFLIQPYDLPERLIRGDPLGYLHRTLDEWCGTPGAMEGEALEEYARCFDAATIHATCEDYRAGATIDLDHDRADADRPVECPTLALWSAAGLGRAYDVADIWRRRAPDFTGAALDCGHFLAEERPEETAKALAAHIS